MDVIRNKDLRMLKEVVETMDGKDAFLVNIRKKKTEIDTFVEKL